MLRVRPHVRRRAPRQRVSGKSGIRPVHHGARGETYTYPAGQSIVFLPETTRALSAYAKIRGVELREAHFRDDVIETMIHESLHAAIVASDTRPTMEREFTARGYPWYWVRRAEEDLVERITKETMESIRELPPLGRRRPEAHR